jgi:hypothetical protein
MLAMSSGPCGRAILSWLRSCRSVCYPIVSERCRLSECMRNRNQSLREHPSARNLDLSSYLLVPSTSCLPIGVVLFSDLALSSLYAVQRLTRYPLLIRQIMQYTDPPPPSIPSPKITSTTSLSTPLTDSPHRLQRAHASRLSHHNSRYPSRAISPSARPSHRLYTRQKKSRMR